MESEGGPDPGPHLGLWNGPTLLAQSWMPSPSVYERTFSRARPGPPPAAPAPAAPRIAAARARASRAPGPRIHPLPPRLRPRGPPPPRIWAPGSMPRPLGTLEPS